MRRMARAGSIFVAVFFFIIFFFSFIFLILSFAQFKQLFRRWISKCACWNMKLMLGGSSHFVDADSGRSRPPRVHVAHILDAERDDNNFCAFVCKPLNKHKKICAGLRKLNSAGAYRSFWLEFNLIFLERMAENRKRMLHDSCSLRVKSAAQTSLVVAGCKYFFFFFNSSDEKVDVVQIQWQKKTPSPLTWFRI